MEFTVKRKIIGISSSINRFLYSVYYPAFVSLWAFFCFALKQQMLGLFVMIAVACLILIFNKDILPVLPLFASCILTINRFQQLTNLPFIIAYCVLGACFIYHFIKYPFKRFYLGKLFFPLCLVSFALFLGGILSRQGLNRYAYGLTVAFSTGPLVLVIYLLFINAIFASEKTNIPEYVCSALISATVCACFEIFFIYLTNVDIYFAIPQQLERYTGWGNFNTVGAMTLIAIPLCCYIIVRTGKYAAMSVVILFMIITDMLCGSDGSLGIIVFSLPFLVVFVFLNLKKCDRKHFISCVAVTVFILCTIGIIIVIKVGFSEIMSYVTGRTDAHGRFSLYKRALELFKSNPIVGIGQGYADESTEYLPTYNVHSTVLHVMATMGIFGVIAYFIYFLFRFKILLGGTTPFNAFAYLSFIAFEAYGLIDMCEFIVIPLMSFITIVILTAEVSNIKGEAPCLPLKTLYKRLNFYPL